MYTFLGITLVLALLLTINATATMIAAGVGRLFRPLLRKCSARTAAEILFVMRIGPPVVAIVSIGAFMIPSYLIYEPHASGESVSWKLGLLATLSAIGVGLAIARPIVRRIRERANGRDLRGQADRPGRRQPAEMSDLLRGSAQVRGAHAAQRIHLR